MERENPYYDEIRRFETYLQESVENIFAVYGRELVLRLEEYNLLQNSNNCIESSTAIGFVLEEFIVSKLEMYTHCRPQDYRIDRYVGSTASQSYDCFAIKDNLKLMVNVKAEKAGSNNNAVAAITQLHRNYCVEDPIQEKAYIVLKIKYTIGEATEDTINRRAKPRHIYIDDIELYCLEEIDFSEGHMQDNRMWSNNSSRRNGRLQISEAFRREHQMGVERISYQETCRMIQNMMEE